MTTIMVVTPWYGHPELAPEYEKAIRAAGCPDVVPPRFWAKVRKTDTCWLWIGGKNHYGYGSFQTRRGDGWFAAQAHRVAYEALVGPIPDGLTIDHLCRNRACVNPAHMEPVTRGENVLRGESAAATHARKTHCKYGHEFTPENTYTPPGRDVRMCRACIRERPPQNRRRRS